MTYTRLLGTTAMAFGLLAAQQPLEDPVMKARAQRARSGSEPELPAIPRPVMEPPPLPAPEAHVKDTRGYRSKRGKKGKASASKKGSTKGRGAKKPSSVKK